MIDDFFQGIGEGFVDDRVLHEGELKVGDGLAAHQFNKIGNDPFVLSVGVSSSRNGALHLIVLA